MLKFENVCFTVPDTGAEIIKDLSLEVKDGEILVVTGPNGGGKSTLARLAMGIITPTSGKILLEGQDISTLDITERARLGVGYAFQAPARFKGLTVRRLLTLAAGGEISDSDCCKYLSRVGLCAADYLDRALDATLSGGELKRIEVASLMVRQLKVAIYDEPEAGIDIWSFNMLVNAFSTLGKEKSGALMIISHQERVMQTADRIAVVAEGKLRDIGAKGDILPKLTDIFQRECIKKQPK
ncbi:MAG: ATP-binding cassette domain-containing protein [Clostridia bacterium]|nr:ATP-binding cassette domain-containing protein [Clostridia bacterium]